MSSIGAPLGQLLGSAFVPRASMQPTVSVASSQGRRTLFVGERNEDRSLGDLRFESCRVATLRTLRLRREQKTLSPVNGERANSRGLLLLVGADVDVRSQYARIASKV